MKYTPIHKSKTGMSYTNPEAVLENMDKLGFELKKVRVYSEKYWITGKYIDGKLHDIISGEKYYRLVLNRFDFGIECKGDYNAWSMAGKIHEEMGKLISEKKSA